MTIEESVRKMTGLRSAIIDIGTATNVRADEELCDVEIAGKAPALNARIGFAAEKGKGALVVPNEGSNVLVAWIGGIAFVLACSDPEKIVWKKGERGGLINVEDLVSSFNNLVDRVNSLVNAYNSHTHTVVITGTAAAQSCTAAPVSSPAQSAEELSREDIEDELISH